jgi:hypothetical protein
MNTVKIASKPLQCIVLIKLLDGTQQHALSEMLLTYVDSLNTHTPVIEYYKLLVNALVENIDEVFENWKKRVEVIDETETDFNLYDYLYRCAIKIYASATLELVCAQANNNKCYELFKDDIVLVEGVGPVLKSANPEFFDGEGEEDPKKQRKPRNNKLNSKAISSLEVSLKASVIGQDKAINKIISYVKLKEAGFVDFFSVLLVGKTGSGKTHSAKKLAEFYTGGRIFTIDCALATEGHEKSSLLGAPPGYVGHTGTSFLGEKAKVSNNWIILLDEIEKANDKTLDNLLNFIDTGKINDNSGNELDFSKSIFVMTSNQGIEYARKSHKIGWIQSNHLEIQTDEDVISGLEKRFKKEFLNRIDLLVVVNDLLRADIAKIVGIELSPYPVKQTPELIDFIVNNAFSEEYGARNIKRYIKEFIGVPVADTILSSGNKRKQYLITVEDGKLLVN